MFGLSQFNVGPRRDLPEPKTPAPAVLKYINHLLAVGRDHSRPRRAVEGQLRDPHILERRRRRRDGPVIFVEPEASGDYDRRTYQGEDDSRLMALDSTY